MLYLGNMKDDTIFFAVPVIKPRLGNLGHSLDYSEESVTLLGQHSEALRLWRQH